jgi:hypothetical protein
MPEIYMYGFRAANGFKQNIAKSAYIQIDDFLFAHQETLWIKKRVFRGSERVYLACS